MLGKDFEYRDHGPSVWSPTSGILIHPLRYHLPNKGPDFKPRAGPNEGPCFESMRALSGSNNFFRRHGGGPKGGCGRKESALSRKSEARCLMFKTAKTAEAYGGGLAKPE